MKLCPKCNLNYIADHDDLCNYCKTIQTPVAKSFKKSSRHSYREQFTFRNEPAYHRGKRGYKAYNSAGECIGIVCMIDDRRLTAYGNCQFCFYPQYYAKYGEWCRFTSHGAPIKWDFMCARLENDGSYTCYID